MKSLGKQEMRVEGEREKWCGFRVGLWSKSHHIHHSKS